MTATELQKMIEITPEETKLFAPPTSGKELTTSTPITSPSSAYTSTPEPTELSEMRRDVILYAIYLEIPPSMDGDLSEWNTQSFIVNYLVYGQSNYRGVEDLSAIVMMGWDETYYI